MCIIKYPMHDRGRAFHVQRCGNAQGELLDSGANFLMRMHVLGQPLDSDACPWSTFWFGCMSSAFFLIRMHVHGQPLDSDACPRPPPWFGSMSMVNLLFWMHVLLLDSDACPRPPSGFGCMSLANFLIRMPPYLLFMIKFKTGQGMIFLTLVWAGDDTAR